LASLLLERLVSGAGSIGIYGDGFFLPRYLLRRFRFIYSHLFAQLFSILLADNFGLARIGFGRLFDY
jgi:hypothetical protein